VSGKPLPAETVGVTQLIICQAGGGAQVCRGYAIRTGRKVSIAPNGQFQEKVEDNRVTIDASPGSTVTVTDAGAPVARGPRPAARIDVEEFDFSVNSPDTEGCRRRGCIWAGRGASCGQHPDLTESV
jgi:hypothetical protein